MRDTESRLWLADDDIQDVDLVEVRSGPEVIRKTEVRASST